MRIVAALFALGMPTAVLAADAPIPLTARPESSKVGGQPVVIAIEAPNLDAGDLRCASSVGKTLGPIAVAPGRHACRLTPPPSGPSQVAIIVVYSDRMDGPIAATFVPIAGRGGGDYPRALLFTRPAVIPADGVSQAQVNLFSLDRMGAPFGAEFSRVVTSAGKLAPLRAAGVGRAVAMLTAPSAGDGVDLEARLADGGNKVNARARITLTAAPPTRVALTGPKDPVQPGGMITVQISLSSAGGAPAGGTLKLRTDSGRRLLPLELGVGLYSATFQAPTGPPGTVTVFATAEPLPGILGKPLQASLGIPVGMKAKPPPPAEDFLPPPTSTPVAAAPVKTGPTGELRAVFDGPATVLPGRSRTIAFALVDKDGDRFTPDKVRVTASAGEVSVAVREGNRFVVEYMPPQVESGSATLAVALGGKRLAGEGTVQIRVPGRQRGKLGVTAGLFLGGMTNLGRVAAPDFELVGMYALPRVPGLRLGAILGFAPGSAAVPPGCPESQTAPAAAPTGTPGCPAQSGVAAPTRASANGGVGVRGIPLAARAEYFMPFGEAELFGGGVLGLLIVNGSAIGSGAQMQSFTTLALYKALFLGLAYPLGPGAVAAELRWSGARFDYDAPEIQALGNLGGPTGLVGYQVNF